MKRRSPGDGSVYQPYTLTVRENGKLLKTTLCADPFANTTIYPRGWRVALRVLLGRYEVSTHMHADKETVDAVMCLDPDYIGTPERRAAFNAELEQALHNFANAPIDGEDWE